MLVQSRPNAFVTEPGLLGIYTRDLCSGGAKAPCRCLALMTSCYNHHTPPPDIFLYLTEKMLWPTTGPPTLNPKAHTKYISQISMIQTTIQVVFLLLNQVSSKSTLVLFKDRKLAYYRL